MNKRRLSYGLLVTLAAGALLAACGGDQAQPETPVATATAADTAAPAPATAEAAPAPTPAPEPAKAPEPPPKPSKDKWVGNFTQDFSGEVADAAEALAKKTAGKNDKDNKKHDAAIAKAKAAVADNTLVNAADSLTWNVKGKPAHSYKITVTKGDDPSTLSFQIVADGKKDMKKKPIDVTVTFSDDNTFTMKDPLKDPAKAPTLVFKRQ